MAESASKTSRSPRPGSRSMPAVARSAEGIPGKRSSTLALPTAASMVATSEGVCGRKRILLSQLADQLFVGVRVHQLFDLGDVLRLQAYEPAVAVGIFVDGVRGVGKLLVHL